METTAFDALDFAGAFIPHENFYMAPTPSAPEALLYQLNRGGYTSRTPAEFRIARTELHALNMLHCVTGGRGYVQVRGKTRPLQPGQFFVLPAHEAHTYGADPDDPMGLLWIEFVGGDSNRLTKHLLDAVGPVFGGELFRQILPLCRSLLAKPHPTQEAQTQILYHILTVLTLHCAAEYQARNPKDQAILAYIDAHLGQRLTLAAVGAAFGYHPTYLSARFSQIAGVPFSQYILRRRLSRACELLVSTDLTIEQIAQELGFYDVSHFTQRFKRAEGIAPSHYRKYSRSLTESFEMR